MIKVTNNADTAKVLITGEIGSGFWNDGYTFEKFKNDINGDFSNIEIDIASLGGDILTALAIHDEMKKNPAHIKVRISGATASAGTVIAMGGDEIEITENSRFLIHRASTFVDGNVEEIEKAADELASYDEQLVNIYQKKTGKRKTQIIDLMKQEKFLTSQEAIDWGFVNRIVKNKVTNKKEKMETENIKTLLNVADDSLIEAEIISLIAFKNDVEAKRLTDEKAKLTNLVEQAITAGKIKADAKEAFLAMTYEAAETIINNIVIPAVVNTTPIATTQEPAVTKDVFFDNYKKNVYKNNIDKMKADYKTAYGKEWV